MQKKNAPCKFWAQGTCKFGQSCSFLHVGPPGGGGNPKQGKNQNQNFQSNNRFATLSNPTTFNQGGNQFGGGFGQSYNQNQQSQQNQQGEPTSPEQIK